MFDIGKIGESADQMAQAGAGIAKSLEAIVNLSIEQNALLGALVLDTIEEGSSMADATNDSSDIRDMAARAIQRYLSNQARSNG